MPTDGAFVLVAGLSGRALAQAACRAGYRPLVADMFGDLDTRAASAAVEQVRGDLHCGLPARGMLAAIDRLAAGRTVEGIVCGAGFEDRPGLLRRLAKETPLLGNAPEVVARVKHPERLAALCLEARVPHPAIRRDPPQKPGWLLKRVGASGGEHIRPAAQGQTPGRWHYWQRFEAGRPVSALFLADGQASLVLGFSEQWAAPAPGLLFRYGGAAGPAVLTETQAASLSDAVARLVSAARLVGLNAVDFLLRDDETCLLEINPRPGASLDVFPFRDLFAWHVAACRGRLPAAMLEPLPARAAQIVYAEHGLCLPPGFVWPDWAADRQPPGEMVAAGGPLCTVIAEASTITEARALAEQRAAEILSVAEQST